MQTGGSMNRKYIPNILTALRMLGAVLLLLTEPLTLPFYLLHGICGLTDALDGAFARALHASSRFGAQLDSIADLMFRAKGIIAKTYNSLECLAVVAIIYFILTFLGGRLIALMERRMSYGRKK